MTKGVTIFGLVLGGTLGLFIPRIFGNTDMGLVNLVTAVMGAVVGVIGMAAIVHFYGRIQ